MSAPRRLQPEKPGDPTYRQVWRIVDGAVKMALDDHPEYVASNKRLRTVRNSIVKRVTGAIHSYAEQSAWVRSGSSPADDKESGGSSDASRGRRWDRGPGFRPGCRLNRREVLAASPATTEESMAAQLWDPIKLGTSAVEREALRIWNARQDGLPKFTIRTRPDLLDVISGAWVSCLEEAESNLSRQGKLL